MADFSSLKFELDSWTLASDERFLNQMKVYFGEVMNRIGVVDRLADTIDYNSTLVHSVINSSFNTLSNLSNSCFLENAMEEPPAETGLRKSVVQETPKPTGNFEANLISNFAKAVKLGMDGLEILKEEEDNDKGSVVSSQAGAKFDRLPAIVGSKIFKDEDFLGIIEKMEEPQMPTDLNNSMMNGQGGAVGMAQSTSLNQSQQQINAGGSNLAAPNLNLNQPQNNTSSSNMQAPPLLNLLQQSNNSSNLQPPMFNPSGPSGGSGGLPPPNLGLLIANKEEHDKLERENRVQTQVGESQMQEQQAQQAQQTRPTGVPQMSIGDALKLRFADQNKGSSQQPSQIDDQMRRMTFDPKHSQPQPSQEQTSKRLNDIASNPMYRLNPSKNLNNMFDDDEDADDDFGGDLFKGSKKKNKFQDLLSGNPQPIKNLEEPPTKMTLIANPLRQEQSAMTKEPQKVTSMKEQPSKKNALFTDTETDNDISNINTENKKLKNLFADTEDEDDVLQRGRQLTNLYKKENQLEEPKKVSKLFMDEENNTPLNMLNKLEAEKKNESNQSQLDISQEETKDMGSSQRVSTTRPSVTKVSGRISELHNRLNINMDALKVQAPSAKPYLRPSIKGEGSTTPRTMQEQNADNSMIMEPNSNTNQNNDAYNDMLLNKAPIAIRKTKKIDFDDSSDNDSNKWSDNDSVVKTQKPTPQPIVKPEEKPQPVIKQEEKAQPQPITTQTDSRGEVSPRNYKFENAQTDYFGKNELLGGDMTASVTSTKLEDKKPDVVPKENPMDLLKALNQPVETKPKTQPKKEEKSTFVNDPNNPLALLNGLKTMDKQHKKEKKSKLFDDDDDDGLFKKPPPRKSENLWGDEPSEPKKNPPPKKTRLFDDSDDDNTAGGFFKKATGELQKPTFTEPKKDLGSKPKRPLWDDSD